jgi:hypothetical protein
MALTQFSRKSLFANDNLDGIDFPTDVDSYSGTITADLSGYYKASILPASLLIVPFTRPLQPLPPGVTGSSASITADLTSAMGPAGVQSTFSSDIQGTMGSGSTSSQEVQSTFTSAIQRTMGSGSIPSFQSRGALTKLTIRHIIPPGNSGETANNGEPSLAVNPLDPRQIIAGAFDALDLNNNPYFKSTDGGDTWDNYGTITHGDKSLAWLQDGSAALTATLQKGQIVTYSGTIDGSNFGSSINTFGAGFDQPWIRTGPSNHVYIAYNDFSKVGALANPVATGNGLTASVLVATDGFSNPQKPPMAVVIDRLASTNLTDSPEVRLAVNGNTVYAAFTHWTSVIDSTTDPVTNKTQQRYTSQVVVVRSDKGGEDKFMALGSGGCRLPSRLPIPQIRAAPTRRTLGFRLVKSEPTPSLRSQSIPTIPAA